MTAPRSTGPLRILPGDAACALHDVAASLNTGVEDGLYKARIVVPL